LTADPKIATIRLMEIVLVVIFGILGSAIGSFLNVCIDRLPENRSLLGPPSHCDGCQRKLGALDLIPVFSYLFLRGRCRTCGARIPLRVFLVELGCGLLTALLFWLKGLTLSFAFSALYSYIFIVIGLIDLKTQLILNKIVYPAFIAGLIIAPFFITGGDGLSGHWINGLIGAGVGFGFLLIPVIVTRGNGMGFGDVKMAALMGIATGFGEVFVAVLGGIILGGLAAIILVVFRLKKRKDVIPFGPFLSLATLVTLIWGTDILHWWMLLFTK
jgi:leader peptidase (prepilin peptidase) / N-methyltransferase